MAPFANVSSFLLGVSLWQIVLLFVFITVPLYSTGKGIYYAYFHPLSKVPGPKLYVFTQIPYLYHLLKADWHVKLKEFHDQYGPVVRYSFREVSFSSATAMRTVYGHKSAGEKTFEKAEAYRHGRKAPNIINADNEDHRRMRRLISHAFSEKALNNQESVLKYYVELFISRLMEKATSGDNIVNLTEWYNFATFDLIGDLTFGQSFHCLETGAYHPWIQMIFQNIKVLSIGEVIRRLNIQSLVPYLIPAKMMQKAKEHMELSAQTALRRLETKNTEREDFMSYILRYNDERGMTTPEIIENANVLIIAGSETTATLLSGTTYYLLMNPEQYRKAVEEIRSAFESEDEITLIRVNQLQYMLAVLNEGLRMYPPVPSGLPRAAPAGGDFVDGYFIPEDSDVSVPHFQAFRSSQNFRDSEKFIPERWVGDDPRYTADEKSVLQPFSIGPRNCIGKNLAYAEMRLLLARLLWNFDLEIMDDSKGWDQQRTYVLWEKGSLNVKLTRVEREKKA